MTPAAATRRYVAVSALTWLPPGLQLASLVLLMHARGLDVASAGLVFATYGALVAVLELPTGGLADVIARRTVLVASAVLTIASLVALVFATELWQFLACAAGKALARALSTGPAQAWYVDTMHAADPAADLGPGLARGDAAGSAALAVGVLAGGALPMIVPLPDDGLVIPLAVPMIAAAIAGVALLVVALGMTEARPDRPRPRVAEVLAGVPATVVQGARIGVRDRVLARVLSGAVALGVALNAIELLAPGRLADATGDLEAGGATYAVVAAMGFAAAAVGSGLGPLVSRLLGAPGRTVVAGALLAAGSLLALAASAHVAGLAGLVATMGGYVGMFVGLGLAGPFRSQVLHDRITSRERATVVSVDSLLLQAGGAAGAIGLAQLADRAGLAAAWAVAGTFLLLSAAAYVRLPSVGREAVTPELVEVVQTCRAAESVTDQESNPPATTGSTSGRAPGIPDSGTRSLRENRCDAE
jgi:hypothetical protein